MIATLMAYLMGKFACKVQIQCWGFSAPMTLIAPIAITLVWSACGVRQQDPCRFTPMVPEYLFFDCPAQDLGSYFLSNQMWIWFVCFVSQVDYFMLSDWVSECENHKMSKPLLPAFQGVGDQAHLDTQESQTGSNWKNVRDPFLFRNFYRTVISFEQKASTVNSRISETRNNVKSRIRKIFLGFFESFC